jgi:hypothetical protein
MIEAALSLKELPVATHDFRRFQQRSVTATVAACSRIEAYLLEMKEISNDNAVYINHGHMRRAQHDKNILLD